MARVSCAARRLGALPGLRLFRHSRAELRLPIEAALHSHENLLLMAQPKGGLPRSYLQQYRHFGRFNLMRRSAHFVRPSTAEPPVGAASCRWRRRRARVSATIGIFPDYSAPVVRNATDGVRGSKANPVEGEHQLFGFLTGDQTAEVSPNHPQSD